MKIEIKSTATATRSGTGNNNRPWKMVEQTGWAYCLDRQGNAEPFPQKITVLVEDGQQPYPVGVYELQDGSFYVAQYGKLSLGNLVLVPLKAAVAAPRAA